ncbi:DUF2868 domain-containing protein [Azoarcus sp. TTM-91]|uniref:DUF2868 domain-containing protein n=1 Tax=Azoarcus sp. TTM-91 TaxID=2691581 RepID=UPI00145DB509|nr:DUF2868 domain-containing protein [Azoarcus sp. TTM-91]NMG33711.1 DUF2868 domain-containing protein [Azoarcus sp. TTM-91]
MTPPSPSRTIPPPLESRWLAEIVRRHEEASGPLEDSAALSEARQAPAGLEARIQARAKILAEREGWASAPRQWLARARLASGLAALLALLAGSGMAWGVLGDGSRSVNIVWALAGLLGVHMLSLALWLVAMAVPVAAPAGGLLGRAWLHLIGWLERRPAAGAQLAALTGLSGGGSLVRWGLGMLTHALWALALAAAALALLALLATRRYGFAWETTILPADAFVTFVDLLGRLPAALGFNVPDAATVVASGEAAGSGEAGRRAWSSWLLGCLLVYGLLPRLLLLAVCAGLWARARARLRLDLNLPGYARLRTRLLPEAERLGVRDPAPALAGRAGVRSHPLQGEHALAVGIELGEDLAWPPSGWPQLEAERIDGREQRRACLQRCRQHPPSRLLAVVDARLTPDRGSLALLAELSALAVETRIWMREEGADAVRPSRRSAWEAALAEHGFDRNVLSANGEAALAWLKGEVHD